MKAQATAIVSVVCLVIGLLLGAFIRPDTPAPEPSPAPVPVAPLTPTPDPVPNADPDVFNVVVGQQVKITVEDGTSVAWTVEPPIPDLTTYGDRNESSVSSYRTPGKYTVIAAVATGTGYKDASVSLRRYSVVVAGETPVNPTPGPDPGPTPVDPPGPVPTPVVNEFSDLAKLVPDKAEAKRLAAALRETADEVDTLVKKRKLLSPDEIVALSQEANEKALGSSITKWDKFFTATEDVLTRLAKDGKLNTMTDHVKVWNELATLLESVK